MSKVYIEYNPYTVETIFKINGEEVKTQPKYKSIANKKDKRLQYYLEADDKNWGGLIKELIKIINSKKIDIEFKGRKIDYDDLEYSVSKYKKENNKCNISLKHIKSKEDKDIHKNFCKLIEKVQKSPIKELQNPIIQNAIEEGKSTDFKMSVLATMSSGKSTLINALIGNDLLPSSNKACTATIARIRDNDDKNEFTVECKDKNGKIVYNKKVITFNEEDTQGKITPKEIVKYNSDEKVMYIDIEGRIPEILSEKMNLVLQDTPGPNNSRNEKHGETTQTIIDDKNKGIVLYIMNATQLEINDDKELLDKISEAMKSGGKQSKDRFMFVLNKCDTIDSEKGETLKDIIGEVKNYLKQYKIEDPNIFPVSAQMAKVIRMHKQGVELTRVEKKFLNDYEDYIEYEYLHFDKLATLSESSRKVLEEKLNKAKEKNDKYEEALIHTGIPAIEVAINEYLEKYAYPMKIKKSTEQIQNFIKEQDMMNKLYTNLSEDKEQYKKIREEINIIKEKIDSGKKAKEIKTEINDFKLKTDNKLTEISDEIMKDLESIKVEIKKYEPKLEKNKARVIINDTKSKLEKYEKKFINTLNTFIKDNLIKNGEMLIEKYKKYISDLKEEFIIDGFEFENTLEFQNIKVKDIDNVINQYVEIEDIYGDVEYKNTNKKWYKPWTWFDPDTYTKKEKIGEKEYIYLEKLIQEQITQIDINVENNLDSAQDEYKEEIEKLIEYFKSEVDKIDEFLKLKINQLDKFTINEETIKIKLKESKNMVERMKDINLDLDKLLKM